MTDLRYPIGKFTPPGAISETQRTDAVAAIAALPGELRLAVGGMTDAQLDTPYRPHGWTVRQVVHHLPDSHLNSYIRLKLALTEDRPTIGTYDEARWAELPDAQAPIAFSLALLDSLHERWVYLFRALEEPAWSRRFHHPELGEVRVDELAALYAWHGRHHVAHITALSGRGFEERRAKSEQRIANREWSGV